MAWKEKSAQARKLVEEVKALNLEGKPDEGETGIDSGEKAAEAHRKTQEAMRLAAEAKAERAEEEKSATLALLKEFEAPDPDADEGGAVSRKGQGLDKQEKSASQLAEEQFKAAAEGKQFIAARSKKDLQRLVGKALGESVDATGGYLVAPDYLQNLFAETRRAGNALRSLGWLNVIPVNTNRLLIPKGTGAPSVGFVAEGAPKPSSDQGFGQVEVNIYTAAGISKVSQQLLEDSEPAVAPMISRDLGQSLAQLEEVAALNGSGTNQPRGILNTAGVNPITVGTNTAVAVVDAILDGIVAIQTTYFGQATGILMHARRLAFLQRARTNGGEYLFSPSGQRGPGQVGNFGEGGSGFDLLGIPVGITANMPTTLGAGTNEDAIIVGNWQEALWFQRTDLTLDTSDVAGDAFETNRVHYRLEERFGFTAERFPQAFAVLTGAGLAA